MWKTTKESIRSILNEKSQNKIEKSEIGLISAICMHAAFFMQKFVLCKETKMNSVRTTIDFLSKRLYHVIRQSVPFRTG